MNLDEILKLSVFYENSNINMLLKTARIRKLPNGKYRVLSEKGRNLGTYNSREKAVKRLRQVEYFKHKDDSDVNDVKEENIIDLTKATDFSFSAIMREMRQNATEDQVKKFMELFKEEFDKANKKQLHKADRIALQNSLTKFNKLHKIKIEKNIIKNAALTELGTPAQVGKYLADIVRFTINRISAEKRPDVINSLRKKFYSFNANEISEKKLPASSSIGQSITFVKHVLFNHDPHYVREVLNNLVRNL